MVTWLILLQKRFWRDPTRWLGFWLSLACWATNTTDIIIYTLTELREILHSDGSNSKKWKVKRRQQTSVFTKPKLGGLEDRHCTASRVWRNKHCKPLAETRIEIRRINLEISHRLHLRRSPSSRVTTTVRILATIVKYFEENILC